jgi:hypothetical protein
MIATLPYPGFAVQISMRDTTFHVPDTLVIGILVDSIPATPGVLSYQFVLRFDPTVLAGVSAEAAGTLSEPFGDPASSGDTYPGRLRVAGAGTHAITGTGVLVNVLLRPVSSAGGESVLQFDSVLLNEGNPEATYADTLAHVVVIGSSSAASTHAQIRQSLIGIAPNPARSFVVFTLPNFPAQRNVRIWNVLGQQVMLIPAHEALVTVRTGQLPGGNYFVTLDGQPEWSARFQVIK